MKTNLATAIVAFRAGEIGGSEYALRCGESAEWIARDILRHWRLPAWFAKEDLEQEVLLAAWLFAQRFDPNRSAAARPEAFVFWNAYDKGKKAGHKARAAYRHRKGDAQPSRFERPAGYAAHGVEEELDGRARGLALAVEAVLSAPPDQHAALVRGEELARAEEACETLEELLAVRAVASAGGLQAAARVLYRERKLELRLGSLEQAERRVADAAERVAERLEAARAAA